MFHLQHHFLPKYPDFRPCDRKMQHEIILLLVTAATVGLVHTVVAPDHYLPVVALARAGQWPVRKLIWVAAICGLGRVAAAVILGLLVVGVGATTEWFSNTGILEGKWSAWALIGLGLAYALYSWFRLANSKKQQHKQARAGMSSMTPWLLFAVFILGPCKFVVLALVIPGLQYGWPTMLLIAGVFGLSAMFTMVGLVLLGYYGISFLPGGMLERHGHIAVGLLIALVGLVMLVIGAGHGHPGHGH